MKKTINANIGGMIFHLDEDAFEKCKSYLDSLKSKFSSKQGGDEIISDIESRIAEIFKEKLGGIREVVSLEDINEMVNIMGDPNLFMDEEIADNSTINENQELPRQKKLFRDPEKRVFGGVCSGFGAYLNLDPWVVRTIMILLVLFGGVSFLLYFIFWIAMPSAITTSDRLIMRGKKVDINSIEESVKKEWNETKSGLKNISNNAKSSPFINGIGKFFRISIGVFFLFFSTILTTCFIWAMVSNKAAIHEVHNGHELHLSLYEGAAMLFDTFGEGLIAYISVWLLIIVPSVLFIYFGIHLIFRFRYKLRYVILTGFILWLIGLILGIYTAINTVEKFKSEASSRENPPIMIADSTLIQVSAVESENINGYNMHGLPISNVDFDIEKNAVDSFPTLEVIKLSQGQNRSSATNWVQKINYYYLIDSNKITLATYFMLDKGDKFRAQRVQIKLLLPVGYRVYLDKGTESINSDINNIQEVWDDEMQGHTWVMTKEGLNCEDCEEEIIRKGKNRDHDEDEYHRNIKIKVKM